MEAVSACSRRAIRPRDGAHFVRREVRRRHAIRWCTTFVPGMTLDIMTKHLLDFWLTSEDRVRHGSRSSALHPLRNGPNLVTDEIRNRSFTGTL